MGTSLPELVIVAMASFGVMDALNAIVVVWSLAVKLKEEGKELAAIEKEIRSVKRHLTQIQNRMKNPKHPLGKARDEMCVYSFNGYQG